MICIYSQLTAWKAKHHHVSNIHFHWFHILYSVGTVGTSNFEMTHGKRRLSAIIARSDSSSTERAAILDFSSPVASHTLFVGSVG